MRFSRGGKIVSINLFSWVFVWVIKTLQYNIIDVSERTDINKTSESKECMPCHYWYFKDINFKFQPYFCNGCYAVSMMAYELKKHCNIKYKTCWLWVYSWGVSRDEAVNWLNNYVLEDKDIL